MGCGVVNFSYLQQLCSRALVHLPLSLKIGNFRASDNGCRHSRCSLPRFEVSVKADEFYYVFSYFTLLMLCDPCSVQVVFFQLGAFDFSLPIVVWYTAEMAL